MPYRRSRSTLFFGFLFVCVVATSAADLAVADGKVRLFILSGQSNMAGLNPDVSFTPAVKKEFAGDEVLVVKYAIGGQPIFRWYEQWKLPEGATDAAAAKVKPGDMYAKLMELVQAAVGDRRVDSAAFVWMQGERDAKAGWQSVYEDALRGVVDQLRRDLKRDDLVVVIGRLSDHLKGDANWDAVRAAQEKVADDAKLGAWVDTDDLNDKNGKNDLHYTKDGYAELGRRFAVQASKLIRRSEGAAN
jgi:hypothetical protein